MDEVEKYQLPDNINLPVSKVRKVTGTGGKKKSLQVKSYMPLYAIMPGNCEIVRTKKI